MGTTTGYDFVTVTATNASDSSKTKTASTKVQNSVTTTYTRSVPVINSFSYDKKHIIYPSSYGGNESANALTPTYSVSVTDKEVKTWTSTSSETKDITGTCTVTFSKAGGCSDGAVNSSTGAVTFGETGGGTDVQTDRQVIVKLTATNTNDSSKSKTSNANANQTVDTRVATYTWNGTPTCSYTTPAAAAANSTQSAPYIYGFSCTIGERWGFAGTSIGTGTTVTTPVAQTFYFGSVTSGTTTSTNCKVNPSTGVVTWTSANTSTSSRTDTIYARLKADNTGNTGSYKDFTLTTTQAGASATTYTYYTQITFRNNTGSGTQLSIPFTNPITGGTITHSLVSGGTLATTSGTTIKVTISSGGSSTIKLTLTGTTQLSSYNLVFQQPSQSSTKRKIGSSSSATTTTYTVSSAWSTSTPSAKTVYINA